MATKGNSKSSRGVVFFEIKITFLRDEEIIYIVSIDGFDGLFFHGKFYQKITLSLTIN